jgi:rhomboid protease GluP
MKTTKLNVAKARWHRAADVIVHISRTRDRWKGAVENVITLQKLIRFYDAMRDRDRDSRERLYATVQLAIYFQDDEDVKQKVFRIRKRLDQVTVGEGMTRHITRMGTSLNDWFTPSRIGKHRLWFTPGFVILAICTYSYMVADFRNYKNLVYGWHIGSSLQATFDSDFLNTWKAFNTVSVINMGEGQRWFISFIEHQGLQHIVSNMLMFMVLAGHLERQYGTKRIVLISFISGLGGNLMSAVLEDECSQVVGASGIIFGLAGFWIADLIVNFHFIESIVKHCCFVVAFFVLFLVTVLSRSNVSNWSHLGGLISGTFPSFLVLPRFGRQRLEAVLLYVGVAGFVTYFAILFPLAYYVKLRHYIPGTCQLA